MTPLPRSQQESQFKWRSQLNLYRCSSAILAGCLGCTRGDRLPDYIPGSHSASCGNRINKNTSSTEHPI